MIDGKKKLKVDVYGDETHGLAAVCYALVVTLRARRSDLEHRLRAVKVRHGATAIAEIHCSTMFNEATRSLSAWAHLDYEGLFGLLDDLCDSLVQTPTDYMIAYVRRSQIPEHSGEVWRNADGSVADPPPFSAGPRRGDKELALFCAQAAFGVVQDVHRDSTLEFWIDPDRDSIARLPESSRVTDQMQQTWVDFLENGPTLIKIQANSR